ncbi:Succinyl-CoA synthetase, alpha subunit [Cupriavidus sp. YR651]|uniref:CoA-binding protein n=1 Tax=Cupriavidus sp. YR651 TaxID=1855315 RepID=UPI00088AD7F9|nr:CoA-binding protein [Cupriavidus sp. YR651]SDC87789.1 Succinyl-CoA synthetase, alpha subunit [Cupriavidus sp. YR651]
MRIKGVSDFKYFVGIHSLAEVATREDRVCVLNIMGGESSDVTPVGHAYSGGNVVFGTSPGRKGQVLDTPVGPIPVYNNVREGLEAGHRFNCGVVYLPPSAADDGVVELVRVNPDLKKIFIPTEKMSVHDAREIRALAQLNGIDIFGGNSLGVADAWNQVRIGGALGGDAPGDLLRKGSIAILSNSGSFTTTIAQYMRMAGWGTTTLISSGKDVYIHYAAPEFAYALSNDDRSKAAVLYCEPGGFYERDATFTKPVVACVVGRWKSRLTRAVGHAGAMAGGGDDAESKERWFMEKFGVDGLFTPQCPVFSAKGAVVTNIADIPAALTAVMRANGVEPDFEPEGTMELKPWFSSNKGLSLPADLDLPVVQAPAPYGEQIGALARQIGAVLPRQSMKDTSGASQMDAGTQLTSLHGVSMLDATRYPLEVNVNLALLHEPGGVNDQKLINVALAASLNLHGHPALAAAQAARDAGNAPNSVLAAAASILGPRSQERARALTHMLIDAFAATGLEDATNEDFDTSGVRLASPGLFVSEQPDDRASAMLKGIDTRGAKSVFVRYLRSLPGHPTEDAVLAAISATLAWGPLKRKRVSRITAESLPWWMQLFGALIGASVPADRHQPGAFCGMATSDLLGQRSITEVAFVALLGLTANAADLHAFQVLVGLLLSNGPGTISAQGAKGAVSADGPEDPERVQLNKALVGFLTHTGYAHGGNGYEGIAFLIDQFRDAGLQDPGDPGHGIDLKALAQRYVRDYADYKANKKNTGSLDIQKIPGVNHPVFKDKPVNHDPREVFIGNLFAERGEYNVFHAFYRTLVQTLFDEGVSRNVYCVNIDAVIAALLLKMLWRPWQSGQYAESALETAAFTIFLYPRMLGCAAEIDDHLNRGRNMDTRTAASKCGFVA